MRFLLLAFSIFLAHLSLCQSNDADSPDFLSERLYGYEDIDFVWKVEGKLQVFLNEGINYLKEGNPAAALANLNDFIKQDSTFWVARYYRGVTHKLLRKLKNAEVDFLAALALNKNSYESMVEMGKIFQFRNNAKRAEKWYNQAIQLNPKKALAYYMKGELELYQRNPQQAIKNYKICIERDPQFSDAKTKLALIEIIQKDNIEAGLPYLNDILQKDSLNRVALLFRSSINVKKNPKSSIKDLNTLIRISPENIEARFSRGILLIEQGEFESAFVDMRRVIQANHEDENNFIGQQSYIDKRIDILNAGNYTTRNVFGFEKIDADRIKKGFCLLLVSKYKESINVLNDVSNTYKTPLTLYLKALAFEHMGYHPEALKLYDLALTYDNDIIDAHKKRGIYLSELGDWSAAEKDFTDALEINPELYVINKLRGVARYRQNNYSGAASDFSIYILRDSIEQEHSQSNLEVIGYRAMAYKNCERYLDAINDFLVSNNYGAIDHILMSHSIMQLTSKGDTAKAMSYLNQYIRQTPTFVDARILKIKILVNQKKWPLVDEEVDLAIKFSPEAGEIKGAYSYLFFAKGLALAAKKSDYDAHKFFSKSLDLDKNNVSSYLERGKLNLRMNRKKQALKDLETAQKLGSQEASKMLLEIK